MHIEFKEYPDNTNLGILLGINLSGTSAKGKCFGFNIFLFRHVLHIGIDL